MLATADRWASAEGVARLAADGAKYEAFHQIGWTEWGLSGHCDDTGLLTIALSAGGHEISQYRARSAKRVDFAAEPQPVELGWGAPSERSTGIRVEEAESGGLTRTIADAQGSATGKGSLHSSSQWSVTGQPHVR
jgi:hypothetical protein